MSEQNAILALAVHLLRTVAAQPPHVDARLKRPQWRHPCSLRATTEGDKNRKDGIPKMSGSRAPAEISPLSQSVYLDQ